MRIETLIGGKKNNKKHVNIFFLYKSHPTKFRRILTNFQPIVIFDQMSESTKRPIDQMSHSTKRRFDEMVFDQMSRTPSGDTTGVIVLIFFFFQILVLRDYWVLKKSVYACARGVKIVALSIYSSNETSSAQFSYCHG